MVSIKINNVVVVLFAIRITKDYKRMTSHSDQSLVTLSGL